MSVEFDPLYFAAMSAIKSALHQRDAAIERVRQIDAEQTKKERTVYSLISDPMFRSGSKGILFDDDKFLVVNPEWGALALLDESGDDARAWEPSLTELDMIGTLIDVKVYTTKRRAEYEVEMKRRRESY